MDFHELKNEYEGVPNEGALYEENGKLCYWTLSNAAKVGEIINRSETAFCPLGPDNVVTGSEPECIREIGGQPVTLFSIQVLGFYYKIDESLKCAAEMMTPAGRAVKWIILSPLSPVEQQAIALACSSAEEYEENKANIIAGIKVNSDHFSQ